MKGSLKRKRIRPYHGCNISNISDLAYNMNAQIKVSLTQAHHREFSLIHCSFKSNDKNLNSLFISYLIFEIFWLKRVSLVYEGYAC